MKLKSKILSVTLASTMILGTASMSFAANFDITHKTNEKEYSFNQFSRTGSILREVSNDIENFLIEYDGSKYVIKGVDTKVSEGLSFADAVKELEAYEEESSLKVVKKSAINDTFREGKADKNLVVELAVKDNKDRIVKYADLGDITVDVDETKLYSPAEVEVVADNSDTTTFKVTVKKEYLNLLKKGKFDLNITVEDGNKVTLPITVTDAKAAGLELTVTTGASIELKAIEDKTTPEDVVIKLANYNSTGSTDIVKPEDDVKEVLVNGEKLRAADMDLSTTDQVTIKDSYIKLLEDKGVGTYTVEVKLEKVSGKTTFEIVDSREFTTGAIVLNNDKVDKITTLTLKDIKFAGKDFNLSSDEDKELVVKIDGKVLRPTLYTVNVGTIVVDNEAYLQGLSVGKHTMEVTYDGNKLVIDEPEFEILSGSSDATESSVTPNENVEVKAGEIQKIEYTLKDSKGNPLANKEITSKAFKVTLLAGTDVKVSLDPSMPNNVKTVSIESIGALKGKTDANGKIAIYVKANDLRDFKAGIIEVDGVSSKTITIVPSDVSGLTSTAKQNATTGSAIELELTLKDQYGNDIKDFDGDDLKKEIKLTPGSEVSKFEINSVTTDADSEKYTVKVDVEFKVNETETDVDVEVKGVNLGTIKDVKIK